MTTVVVQNQQGGYPAPVGVGPVIVQSTNTPGPNTPSYENYPTKMSIITGVLRVALVIVAVVLEIIAIQQGSVLRYYGYQTMWNGVCLLASGALGIAAGARPNSALVVSHLVLSIISSIFSLVQAGIGGVGWGVDRLVDEAELYGYSDGSYDNESPSGPDYKLAATITCIGIAQFILNLWGSILGCTACCCSSPQQSTTTTTTTYNMPARGVQPQPGFQPHPPGPQMDVDWTNNAPHGDYKGGFGYATLTNE